MKQSNRMIHRRWALTVSTVFVVAIPLFAMAAFQSDSAAEISDEKLKAVASAYIQVFKINQSYKAKIEASQTTEEANELQQTANQEMIDAIESEENVTVNEYNEVIGALADDEELRERLQAHVDEIQEQESEKD